jgi:hypothetical protein
MILFTKNRCENLKSYTRLFFLRVACPRYDVPSGMFQAHVGPPFNVGGQNLYAVTDKSNAIPLLN